MTRFAYFDQLALVALISVSTYLLIGDFGVRLANTSTDDGLVGYAYFFKYPERFAQDAHMLSYGSVALTSMLNWLPALLFRYLDVPPEIFFGLFTFLQNIMLALAVYRLAIIMTQSRESAWIAAIFTLAFRPQWWNLGLFADLDWMPYSAWVALPFLVFAGAYALDRRFCVAAIMLLMGGLIHPILGLFAAAMMGAYWLLISLQARRLSELLLPGLALCVAVALFLLPVLIARLDVEEAPSSHILSLILRNGHAIPWDNPGCTYCMPFFLRVLVIVPTMTVLALLAADRETTHPNLRMFLLACALVSFAACLLHVIAYMVGNTTILRVIGFRSTILLLIFTVPPVIALAWRQFCTAAPFVRLLAGYVILLPSPAALVAALLVLPGSARSQRTPSGTTTGTLVCQATGAALFVLLLARHVPKLGPRVDIYLLGQVFDSTTIPLYFGYQTIQFPWLSLFTAAFLVIVVAWQWYATRRGQAAVTTTIFSMPAWALSAWAMVYLMAWNHDSGQQATKGEAREYYEVQVWARASTPVSARFIVGGTSVYEGWRNFTHRSQITLGGCGFYSCSKASIADGVKYSEFFAQHGNAGLTGLNTEGMRSLARTFGGEYTVRRKAWAPLNFPIAFENAVYVVYDLR